MTDHSFFVNLNLKIQCGEGNKILEKQKETFTS